MASSNGKAWFIYECTDQTCRFRFPAMQEETRAAFCPRCGAGTYSTAIPQAREQVGSKPGPGAGTSSNVQQVACVDVLADNVRSAYNVGSLLRTADGAGVRHMYLCGITPTPDQPKVAKTALGAEKTVSWTYHRNSLQVASDLQRERASLVALETVPHAQSLFQTTLESLEPVVLVIGNEVIGIDPSLLEQCDRTVMLPMAGSKRSLNVASACAVAVYWLRYGRG